MARNCETGCNAPKKGGGAEKKKGKNLEKGRKKRGKRKNKTKSAT